MGATTRRGVKPTGRLGDLVKARNSRGVLLPLFKEVMIKDADADAAEQAQYNQSIRPSEMAKADWCPRTTFYRIKGYPVPDDKLNLILENIYEEGNSIHEKWQRRARKTGKLWGLWKCYLCCTTRMGTEPVLTDCRNSHGHMWKYCEVPMRPGGTAVAGHADGAFISPLNCLMEIKSVGVGTLRFEAPKLLSRHYYQNQKIYDLDGLWKDLRRPFSSHVRQGNIYLWLAELCGLPFDRMVFLYEFKPNQQFKEFVVSKSDTVLRPLLEQVTTLEHALDCDVPPPCPYGGCKQCQEVEQLVKSGTRPGSPQRDAPDGAQVLRGSAEAGEAGDSVGGLERPAPRRTTRRSQGHHDASGPAPDGAVPEAGALGSVPGASASGGSDRRAVRRIRGRKDKRVHPDS